jgi:hypothetical protein
MFGAQTLRRTVRSIVLVKTTDRAIVDSSRSISAPFNPTVEQEHMNAKNPVLAISLIVIAQFAGLNLTRAQTVFEAEAISAISNLENEAVKADLGGDAAFYKKVLAEDWTRGDSDGTFYTKAQLLDLMADTKNIKTSSEQLSDLKVRVYGDTAEATYKDTYDILIKGQRRAHTIIATDTFVKIGGEWKQVASHGSEAK